jgi:hypothetical protein
MPSVVPTSVRSPLVPRREDHAREALAARESLVSVAPAHARIPVGVVVERRRATSPWIDFTWQPVGALPGRPDAAPWSVLSIDAGTTTFYAGSTEIALYRTEGRNYRDNLAYDQPLLWIALRPTGLQPPYDLLAVTADPAEGESFTQAGKDVVATVPMPAAVRDIVEAFVAAHPGEQPFHKRKRDPADADALAHRRPRAMD